MKFNVGVIGGGLAAQGHIKVYQQEEDVRVAAIAEPNDGLRAKITNLYPDSRITADYSEILKDASINLIDICVPHFLHYPITMEAFKAGKNVIVEKPIALNLTEADKMIKESKRTGCRFFVALNQRFLPVHQKVKKLLEDGEIGSPFFALAICIGDEFQRMSDPHHWKGTWNKAGGGALADTGTHLVDLMHYFFGEAIAVTATSKRLRVSDEKKADDTSTVTIEFKSGVLAEVVVTYAATSDKWSEKKHIYGNSGSLHVDNDAENPLCLVRDKNDPRIIHIEHDPNWWEYSVRKEIRHFLGCIRNDREPLVSPEDARRVLETITLAYLSAREGKRISRE